MIRVERLKTIPLFAGMEDEALARLAPLFHHAHYKLGDIISKQGDQGDAFCVIESGTLRVRRVDATDQESVLDYLTAPSYFGETSLLTGLHRDATVDVFSAEADLLVLPKHEFDAFLIKYPRFKEGLTVRPDLQEKLEKRVYPWLSEGEIVLVNARRHWYALASRLLLPALVAIALLMLAAAAHLLDPTAGDPAAPSNVFTVAAPVLLVLSVVWTLVVGAWNVVDWSNDYFVLTNKRVVHLEKVIFFSEEREEAPIEQVTNVQEMAYGWPARVFGFSDIRVETAARDLDIRFTFVPRSLQIRQHIFDQLDRINERAASERRERIRAGIREELWERLSPDLSAAMRAGGGLFPGATGAPPSDEADAAAAAAVSEEATGEAPVQGAEPVPVILMPIRRKRRWGLGRRINEWFGLRIEEPGRVTWRKHWFILFERIGEPLAALAIVALVGLLHLLGLVPIRVLGDAIQSLQVQVLLISLWILALGAAGFWLWYQYEDWSNDIYRVTDDRVVDIERSPFGLKERSVETTLERVQDVSFVKRGVLANLFNFGNLIIETAGGEGRLTFYNVIDPREAAQEIFRRRDVRRSDSQGETAREERRDMLDWFMEYHRFLQEQGEVKTPQPAPPPAPEDSKTTDSDVEAKGSA